MNPIAEDPNPKSDKRIYCGSGATKAPFSLSLSSSFTPGLTLRNADGNKHHTYKPETVDELGRHERGSSNNDSK